MIDRIAKALALATPAGAFIAFVEPSIGRWLTVPLAAVAIAATESARRSHGGVGPMAVAAVGVGTATLSTVLVDEPVVAAWFSLAIALITLIGLGVLRVSLLKRPVGAVMLEAIAVMLAATVSIAVLTSSFLGDGRDQMSDIIADAAVAVWVAVCLMVVGAAAKCGAPTRIAMLGIVVFAAGDVIGSTLLGSVSGSLERLELSLHVAGLSFVTAGLVFGTDRGPKVKPIAPERVLVGVIVTAAVPIVASIAMLGQTSGEVAHVVRGIMLIGVLPVAGVRLVVALRDLIDAHEDRLGRCQVDSLTGLRSREAVTSYLDQPVGRRLGGLPPSVLVIDIDGFLALNTTRSYLAGDEVLRESARRLTAIPELAGALVARTGDDEFTVVLSDRPSSILGLADTILATIRRPFDVKGGRVEVTASIGITASAAPTAISGHGVVHWASRACQVAKSKGGDRAEVYSLAMSPAHRRQLNLFGMPYRHGGADITSLN